MTIRSETTRRLLWVGLTIGAVGLVMNGIDWWHGTLKFAAPKLIDQIGMLLLVGAIAANRLSATIRMRITIVALALIVPSTALIVVHAL